MRQDIGCHNPIVDRGRLERDGRKEKVQTPDKESSGMDKGVEGRKKGYGVGWRPPHGWGSVTSFASPPLDGGV